MEMKIIERRTCDGTIQTLVQIRGGVVALQDLLEVLESDFGREIML